ncbi:MAG: hypothetical protein LBQ15_05050 [Clostridium sp.]|nr:hypothetical protein [Clostridium sp.]
MIDPQNPAMSIWECSLNGRIIPAGVRIYRGDNRRPGSVWAAGGFVPSAIRMSGETSAEHARRQAESILQQPPDKFIHCWTVPDQAPESMKDLIVGERGRLAGVSCSLGGWQKGGFEYQIHLPKLYALGASVRHETRVCIYGNQKELSFCDHIGMHFVRPTDIGTFVFLTTIPIEWIEQAKKNFI